MAKLLPFQRTSRLIAETDEFLDKVAEALLVFERAIGGYVENRSESELEERLQQIFGLERRADELRRGVGNTLYGQMLMPETRGDLISLAVEIDVMLDSCVHALARLSMERPEIPDEFRDALRTLAVEGAASGQALLKGARAYLKEPQAVRDHLYQVGFHTKEASDGVLRLGRAIFDTELPLDRKLQLKDLALSIRTVASIAEDIGDRLGILAIKRAD